MPDTTIAIASINTRYATELCLRSIRRCTSEVSYRLVVGDCGSTDSTLPMLTRFQRRGWIDDLVVVSGGRRHAAWLDHWVATCPTRYLAFVDSDIEIRDAGWLAGLRSTLDRVDGVFSCAHLIGEHRNFVNPVDGVPARLGARPSVHLMLLDVAKARQIGASFESWSQPRPDLPEGRFGFDVGGRFMEQVSLTGARYGVMAPSFQTSFRHWEGMSWARGVRGLRRRGVENQIKVLVKLAGYRVPVLGSALELAWSARPAPAPSAHGDSPVTPAWAETVSVE